MKIILAAIATVFSFAAQADTFAEADNQAGGKIAILTAKCENKTDSRAYYYTSDGNTEEGCWRYDSGTVVIEWEKSGRKRYPISVFKLRNAYRDFK